MGVPSTLVKLNKKQRLFVEAFIGDVVEAAQIAGYTGSEVHLRKIGNQLLSQPLVMDCIKERSRYLNKMGNVVADREERMMFWTSIMNNNDPHRKEEKDSYGAVLPEGNIPMNMRLKASELLGKAEGDFIDRIDLNHKISISDIVMQSYDNDRPLEDIEAAYYESRNKEKKQIEEAEYSEEEEDDINFDTDDNSLSSNSLDEIL